MNISDNYFVRLAQEVGYANFAYRYTLRKLYKLAKVDQKIVLPNGVPMVLPWHSKFGTELFLKRDRLDWGSETLLLKFLDREKSFIDVGANIGYYSLLAITSSCNVYSFEPDPRVVETLKKNLAQFQNAQIIRKALYSEPGTMELSLSASPELNSLVRQGSQGQGISVPVTTLDVFMADYPSLSVSAIKTDVEGADFQVLLGGKSLLIRDQPLVLSEAYPHKKLLRFAESIDFTVFAFAKPKDKNKSHIAPELIKVETQPTNTRVKMIFLVPKRLLSQFAALATEN
ncbi:FkbM family methyltransferase [Coleofasciculus chthonoplastes]|uniref:FkbM family methyltransferase n=1 Tax=Coleofasciculus chthonoplastes TaxID=64178 RepID=UPI0003011D4F|nr:FkbM family methyltransferase [Coleofasciculus chthonoplastes]